MNLQTLTKNKLVTSTRKRSTLPTESASLFRPNSRRIGNTICSSATALDILQRAPLAYPTTRYFLLLVAEPWHSFLYYQAVLTEHILLYQTLLNASVRPKSNLYFCHSLLHGWTRTLASVHILTKLPCQKFDSFKFRCPEVKSLHKSASNFLRDSEITRSSSFPCFFTCKHFSLQF